jgi:hypothetical protein
MERPSTRRTKLLFALALGCAFCFRLAFGLCSDFWNPVGDEKQIYLIGLKFYTTGAWPYFGPDVTNTIQIPGALQGLVVGLPFYVLPIPEAPYLLVNILSFASLCFFAWYCCKRLPKLPRWFVWTWLLTAPWTICLSTTVFNPSYVLSGAIIFFVAAIETYPFLSSNLIPLRWSNLMMGVALFWIMQLHLSWVVLLPYLALSFYFQFRDKGRNALASLAWFGCGAILIGSLLIPTFIKYGYSQGTGNTNEAIQFNTGNLLRHLNVVEGVLGRFLSLASFELPRFIGSNMAMRLEFLRGHRWLIPLLLFLTVVGILQCIAMLVLWFKKAHQQQDWQAVKYFTLATVVLIYISFLFSIKAPLSHTFYLTLPVAMLYSLYCWSAFLQKRYWQRFAVLFLVCGIIFEAGLAAHNYSRVSIYVDRQKIDEAIKNRNYHLLGERRIGAKY